jgi:hypothetical protein
MLSPATRVKVWHPYCGSFCHVGNVVLKKCNPMFIEWPFQTRKQTRRVRWQTGKKIKVIKERVAAASPAVVKAAVDRAAAVRVVADPVVDSVAVEAVATAKR